MAFMLPLAYGVGTVGGFVAGYYYNTDKGITTGEGVTEIELRKIKTVSPHKEIHEELLLFKKNKLRSVEQVPEKDDDGLSCVIARLRGEMTKRRLAIDIP